VLRVLYLVFNEGYSGDVDLAAEAIRLTRQLAAAVDHPEVAGLLALMLLHHARRAARTAPDGSIVPLARQDRGRWDTRLIAEGVDPLQAALARDRLGEFQAQPPSPRCTPTRPPPSRPTGCRSSSGTTSSPA
jgi:predicted RNA polymerase sigma factor